MKKSNLKLTHSLSEKIIYSIFGKEQYITIYIYQVSQSI